MSEIILDSVIDSIKLLPFLFLTYLFMEWLEHKTGAAARKRIRTAGKFGPVWGGLLGVIPQCGFSAAASSLFAGRVITVGTLIAVYLSTSDEMFPIMISNAVPVVTIVKILTCKAVIGILSGLVLEYVYTHILKKQEPDVDIPDNVCAAGNPCRVIREITDADRPYYFKDRKFDEEAWTKINAK